MTLYQSYLAKKKRAQGGDITGLITSLGAGIADATSTQDQYGIQSPGSHLAGLATKGAQLGSMAGSLLGPLGSIAGTAGGAAIGGITGLFTMHHQRMLQKNAEAQDRAQQALSQRQFSDAQISADPSLFQGYRNSSYFKSGGWISKAVNPAHKGYCTPMTKSTCTPRRKAFAMTMKKHHGFHKKAYGGEIKSPLYAAMLEGGRVKNLSTDSAEIIGKSHAKGGVKIPHLDVELEGGETTLGSYVFSKQLGFADLHKKLATAKGVIEKKPLSPERVKALDKISEREQELMMSQELFKHLKGIKS